MIENLTKNNVIVNEKKICDNIFSHTLGLMFSRKIKDKGLVFVFDKERRIDLHMWFVFFPIDVLFLNSDKEVIDIRENFKPFGFYSSKGKYCIELPNGIVKEKKIEKKDKIIF